MIAEPPRTAAPDPTVCTIANRRPRDLATYQAACRAADNDEVVELDARAVHPDMTIWHRDRWLVVRYNQVTDRSVSIDFFVPDGTAMRITEPTTPMYRRITGREQTGR